MIDILIPVLSRPQNAVKVVRSIHEATRGDYTVTFICSPQDWDEIDAVRWTGEDFIVTDWEPGPGDGAKKWNLGFTSTSSPYVLLAADDLEFEYGWDTEALRVAEQSNAGVIGTNDDANPMVKRGLHATHALVRRSYIAETGGTFHDGPGVVYHEGYEHQWVDTELCEAAKLRNQWAFARRSIVRHLHPYFPHRGRERTPMDDTYEKALGGAPHDSALYRQRAVAFKRGVLL